MKRKANWNALLSRLIVAPAYLYLSFAAVCSVFNSELMLNLMSWNEYVRTVFTVFVVAIYGAVMIGWFDGNFKEQQNEQAKK